MPSRAIAGVPVKPITRCSTSTPNAPHSLHSASLRIRLKALAAVQAKVDVDAVSAALRAAYVPWLEESAQRFQEVVKAQGGLNPGAPKAQANAAAQASQNAMLSQQAQGRKEHLTGLFLGKGCKMSDIQK